MGDVRTGRLEPEPRRAQCWCADGSRHARTRQCQRTLSGPYDRPRLFSAPSSAVGNANWPTVNCGDGSIAAHIKIPEVRVLNSPVRPAGEVVSAHGSASRSAISNRSRVDRAKGSAAEQNGVPQQGKFLQFIQIVRDSGVCRLAVSVSTTLESHVDHAYLPKN